MIDIEIGQVYEVEIDTTQLQIKFRSSVVMIRPTEDGTLIVFQDLSVLIKEVEGDTSFTLRKI